jgi:hypothetical protein
LVVTNIYYKRLVQIYSTHKCYNCYKQLFATNVYNSLLLHW